jgi:hypothetical protein
MSLCAVSKSKAGQRKEGKGDIYGIILMDSLLGLPYWDNGVLE